MLDKRIIARAAENNVIEKRYTENLGGLAKAVGTLAVLGGHALVMVRWVVMSHDERNSIVLNCCNENLAGMDNCSIHEANRNDVNLDDLVSAVECNGEEAFVARTRIAGERSIDVLGSANLIGCGVTFTNELVDHKSLLGESRYM
jgi:hypothetical protein